MAAVKTDPCDEIKQKDKIPDDVDAAEDAADQPEIGDQAKKKKKKRKKKKNSKYFNTQ